MNGQPTTPDGNNAHNSPDQIITHPALEQTLWVFWSFFWRSVLFSLIFAIPCIILLVILGGFFIANSVGSSAIGAAGLVITLFLAPFVLYLTLYLPMSALINKSYTDFRIALLPGASGVVPQKSFSVVIRVVWAYFWRYMLAYIALSVFGFALMFGLTAVMAHTGVDMTVILFALPILSIAASFAVMVYFLGKALNKDYGNFQVRFVERTIQPDVYSR